MQVPYYKVIGFTQPWIGYFAIKDKRVVGTGGYKGAPKNQTVEIAYSTFPDFEGQGIGTEICYALVELAQQTNASIRITARTLPEWNASTRILQKNQFVCLGSVIDPEDGEVWEWEHKT